MDVTAGIVSPGKAELIAQCGLEKLEQSLVHVSQSRHLSDAQFVIKKGSSHAHICISSFTLQMKYQSISVGMSISELAVSSEQEDHFN